MVTLGLFRTETIQSRARGVSSHNISGAIGEWCMLHGASRVETMLDPFLGIGNSAVAAQKCGVRKFIGFEIDETYLAEAKRRIERNHAIASQT